MTGDDNGNGNGPFDSPSGVADLEELLKPKPDTKFQPGNKAASKEHRAQKADKGIAGYVRRKYGRKIADRLWVEANNADSATSRTQALRALAAMGYGQAPSAVQMGTLEPLAKPVESPAGDLMGMLRGLAGGPSLLASLQAMSEPVASYAPPSAPAPMPAPEPVREASTPSESAEAPIVEPEGTEAQPGPSAEWAEKLPGCTSMAELVWKRVLQ